MVEAPIRVRARDWGQTSGTLLRQVDEHGGQDGQGMRWPVEALCPQQEGLGLSLSDVGTTAGSTVVLRVAVDSA